MAYRVLVREPIAEAGVELLRSRFDVDVDTDSPLGDIIETDTVFSPMYVAVWIADDPGEVDADPATDANGILMMRAQAFGPSGTTSVVEVTLARTDSSELERGYTGQRGQDEQNRRARKAAVETPGKALSVSGMSAETGGFTTQ